MGDVKVDLRIGSATLAAAIGRAPPTLLVILGPLAASAPWAMKRNVALRMSKTEMMARSRLAMVNDCGVMARATQIRMKMEVIGVWMGGKAEREVAFTLRANPQRDP